MEKRGLVPLEVLAVLVAAAIPLPIPQVVPLLAAASVFRWLRGKSWGDVIALRFAGVAAVAGAVALPVALVAGTPLVEQMTGRAVAWSQFPIVRGNGSQLFAVMVVVAASVIAAELVLRGWIVERVLELGGPPVIAVLVGAIAEALVTQGDLGVRLGAAIFGIGLGAMYVAAGRNALAPMCARLAFSVGALLLEAMRAIG